MRLLPICSVLVGSALLTAAGALGAQQYPTLPERSIRNSIPITNSIARAYAAGTRDSTGRPGRNYWQIRTDYKVDVRLDAPAMRLYGKETVTLHNNSPDPLTSIGLRLDMNIFRAHSYLASSWMASEVTDGMVITALSVNGTAADLTAPAAGRGGFGAMGGRGAGAGAQSMTPRLMSGTMTNASISLGEPIPAGAKATVVIEWNHKVPGGPGGSGHRMTQRWGDTLFQPTQWYPRLQVYDDLKGWNNDQYLGPSEFYNNFGTWDVAIDVPAGWLVSGTGLLQNPEQVLTAQARQRLATVTGTDAEVTIVGPEEVGPGNATAPGDRLTWRFHADTVNDFAWLTAKKLVWKAVRANTGTRYIPIHMLYQPGNANSYARAGAVARHSVEFYSKLVFPYEWPQLTMQDGPSSGMEYPMVINSNQGAADHEIVHQWWPMVVSNNETWYGWVDEGLNQYINILSSADAAGTPARMDQRGQSYGNNWGAETEAPLMWNANFAGPGYSLQTYSKMPLAFSMLGGIVGDSAVQRTMGEWGNAWKFKHPSPWDYMFFMNKALKQDLSWFWYYWLFTNETVDGGLKAVTPSATGVSVTVHQAGEMPSPVVLRFEFEPAGPALKLPANGVLKDANTAVLTWPVNVWFNGSRSFSANVDFGGRKLTRVLLDPGCRFPDRTPSDNVWTPENGIGAPAPAGGRGAQGGRGGQAGAGGRGGAGQGGSNLCPGA